MILAGLAWFITDYITHALNWWFWSWQDGSLRGKLAISYKAFLGDPWAWSGVLPWLALWLPAIVLTLLFIARVSLTWPRAIAIGMVICATQLVAWTIADYERGHVFHLVTLSYVLTRIFRCVTGPMVATAASKIDFLREEERA